MATPTPVMYGISNCDTVKKARKWLESHGVHYHFHDVRKDGLDQATVESWLAQLGWEALVNRRGTTWRQLSDAQKAGMDDAAACAAILEQPALFKRPLLSHDGQLHVGFKPDQYSAILAR